LPLETKKVICLRDGKKKKQQRGLKLEGKPQKGRGGGVGTRKQKGESKLKTSKRGGGGGGGVVGFLRKREIRGYAKGSEENYDATGKTGYEVCIPHSFRKSEKRSGACEKLTKDRADRASTIKKQGGRRMVCGGNSDGRTNFTKFKSSSRSKTMERRRVKKKTRGAKNRSSWELSEGKGGKQIRGLEGKSLRNAGALLRGRKKIVRPGD